MVPDPRQDRTSLIELMMALSHALDLVSRPFVRHQQQVCLTILRLGKLLDLPPERLRRVAMAGAVHDIGLLSQNDRQRCLEFEDDYDSTESCSAHMERGFQLLVDFEPLQHCAEIVRFHHVQWKDGAGCETGGIEVPEESHLLHLADRLNVMLDPRKPVLSQLDEALEKVKEFAGDRFAPHHVEALRELGSVEGFWLHLFSPEIDQTICRHPAMEQRSVDSAELVELSGLFSRAVDYRSPYTAAHSAGVGAAARAVSGYMGFSERERRLIEVAGRLHDLGKLCVPRELLEKPEKLTAEEGRTIREHTYHTYCLLDGVKNMEQVKRWAAYHHERVNGKGYPFHMTGGELSLGARAVAVADVFSALTEGRAHRKSRPPHEVRRCLGEMARNQLLDRELAGILISEYEEIETAVVDAQRSGAAAYHRMARQFPDMLQ